MTKKVYIPNQIDLTPEELDQIQRELESRHEQFQEMDAMNSKWYQRALETEDL